MKPLFTSCHARKRNAHVCPAANIRASVADGSKQQRPRMSRAPAPFVRPPPAHRRRPRDSSCPAPRGRRP
jgi:hypothetical protein